MEIKSIFFDIDHTLYDSSLQVESARRNAIKAMIEAGLDVDEKTALESLNSIVKKFGSNYQSHFDELLKEFDYPYDPHIIAAGIVAYHTTKIAYLVPYPDTVPTLIKLNETGYKLGIITDGIPVKQWEKLIRLGLQHFFHSVFISSDIEKEKPALEMFNLALKEMKLKPKEAMMVGDRIDKDIAGANKVGMITVQILRGKYSKNIPKSKLEEPDYVISTMKDLLDILNKYV